MRATHFRIQGLPQVAKTARGTRPGDPIGDILFNIIMQRILCDVRDELRRIGSHDVVQHGVHQSSAHVQFLEISFFDDVAVGVLHPTTEGVMTAAAQVMPILIEAARKRGLSVNFQQDKSELLISFRGTGSCKIKERVMIHQKAMVPIVTEHGCKSLRVSHSYKRLGSYLQADVTPKREVQHRIATAKKAWGPLRRSLWGREEISIASKLKLFDPSSCPGLLITITYWQLLVSRSCLGSIKPFVKWLFLLLSRS